MIPSIHIAGYRLFDRFDMADLGRVNLLVGSNSSGKTSLLEALYLFASRGDPATLRTLLLRRGERVPAEADQGLARVELDPSHLFTGHEARVGSQFTIAAPEELITFSIVELGPKELADILETDDVESLESRLAFQIEPGLLLSRPRQVPAVA